MRNESCGEMSLETSAETTLFPQVIKIGHHEKKERSHSIIYFFTNCLVKNSSLCLFLLLSSLFFLFLSVGSQRQRSSKKGESRERESAARLPSLHFPHTTCCVFPILLEEKGITEKHDDRDIYTHTENTFEHKTHRNTHTTNDARERRRQDDIPKVLRAVERRARER